MVAYDRLGNKVMYDFYFTKQSVVTPPPATPATAATWEVAMFRNANAAVGGTTSFPTPPVALSAPERSPSTPTAR